MILILPLVIWLGTFASEIGGKALLGTKNVQCGIPAANLEQSRDVTDSLSGQCLRGKCSCYDGFGCKNCGGRMILDENEEYTTLRTFLHDPSQVVDICSVEWGGGFCSKDEECHGKGLCIENQCVCYSNWLCPYCEMGLNEDILIGAQCGDYMHGTGRCSSDVECNHGVCLRGACMCESGYVCSHCSELAYDIIKKTATCPCEQIDCGDHGSCNSGSCVCDPGYKGTFCSINICDELDCGSHGICSTALGGVCVCDDGFFGDLCDTQKRGGATCATNEDCGNGVGGLCVPTTKQCECYLGWTCPSCDKVGTACDALAFIHGGAACESNADCGNFGPDLDNPELTGGKCEGGMCVCFEGFTCPHCNTRGNPQDVVDTSLQCDGAISSSIRLGLFLLIFLVGLMVF